MNKSKFLKQILGVLLVGVILLFVNVGEVKAILQANKNTQNNKVDNATNWMTNFRNMEKSGEAMGLNETLNEDLTSSSESNNIDVHMMRTTEYGAIAILSASGYGNPSNEQIITSTTGNNTGVIINTSYWEFTAGGLEENIFSGTNARYYDTYSTEKISARVGDALGNAETKNPGCEGWHQANYNRWDIYSKLYFVRGDKGMFSFYGGLDAYRSNGRGVAVCGIGL